MMDNKNWLPTASLKLLQFRSQCLQKIREFFHQKNILEVDTPLMSFASVTTPAIASITTNYSIDDRNYNLYLQTSPEFYMKRLLAAGSGPIFQICKAFRQGESGRVHNPEFTMLEWYRPGFNHHDLMDEMTEFFHLLLPIETVKRISYEELFKSELEINPHAASAKELALLAKKHDLTVFGNDEEDKDTWLDLLLSHCIEPNLQGLTFVYDFPVSKSALAKIRHDNYPVAERFEAYIDRVELANGFHELADGKEQHTRFEKELSERKQLGLPPIPIDYALLDALHAGFPDCAGVAVGIDRLIMIAAQQPSIANVMSFVTEVEY